MREKFIVVMYHHIRKKNENFFPKLNSLDFNIFKKQLNFLEKKYHIMNNQDLFDFFTKKKKFDKKSCLLTFDDGYLNHYTNVYPELKKRKLQGFFFPPSKAILKRKLMDSNKAHLLLASNVSIKKLNEELEKIFYKFKLENQIKKKFSELVIKYKLAFGFDNAETIFFKRMTQHIIPDNYREKTFKILFKKFIGIKERFLANKLYINTTQAKKMVKGGMFFGNHCDDHLWLENQSEKKQTQEILGGLKFLKSVGMNTDKWIMCYPYGSYNKTTIKILKKNNCFMGLTSKNKVFEKNIDSKFEIPRIDCNNVFEY